MTSLQNEKLGLDAIRERADAATPGPWFVEGSSDVFNETRSYLVAMCGDGDAVPRDAANAAFIACARSDVPALLAVAEAAKHLLAVTTGEHLGALSVAEAALRESLDVLEKEF